MKFKEVDNTRYFVDFMRATEEILRTYTVAQFIDYLKANSINTEDSDDIIRIEGKEINVKYYVIKEKPYDENSIPMKKRFAVTEDGRLFYRLCELVDEELVKTVTSTDATDVFKKLWQLEGPLNKEFLITLIPDLGSRIECDNTDGLFMCDLYNTAFKRMWELGYTRPCPRCGGSGSYSFNKIDGTRCYGCGGKKMVLRRITKQLIVKMKNDKLRNADIQQPQY